MNKVAILSVTDKSGIVEFARELIRLKYDILSTGGTAALLRENDVAVEDISSYTGFPEIMDGRVKTLHPLVHGGILYDRANPEHLKAREKLGARDVALVCVNLYAFVEEAVNKNLAIEQAIEHIDIGGPTLLRAAAKNHAHVIPVIDPADYGRVIEFVASPENSSAAAFRRELAGKAFASLADYNGAIANYLLGQRELRYGENPHQKASIVSDYPEGFAKAMQHQGKELSYNNYLDMDAAYGLVQDFTNPALAIVKHNNPCGLATSATSPQTSLYHEALRADSKSAFGGIVACNRTIEAATAEAMSEHFFECILAPGYEGEALEIFAKKKNLRVLTVPPRPNRRRMETRQICGAKLTQERDEAIVLDSELRFVTETKAEERLGEMTAAFTVAKHVKSNAIVLFKNEATVGIGAGQMSRIDACELAVKKAIEADLDIKGSILASDAFFPFRDTVEFAARHGISAIIQPGGSVRDQDSIDAANEAGIAMAYTGMRHFRH